MTRQQLEVELETIHFLAMSKLPVKLQKALLKELKLKAFEMSKK